MATAPGQEDVISCQQLPGCCQPFQLVSASLSRFVSRNGRVEMKEMGELSLAPTFQNVLAHFTCPTVCTAEDVRGDARVREPPHRSHRSVPLRPAPQLLWARYNMRSGSCGYFEQAACKQKKTARVGSPGSTTSITSNLHLDCKSSTTCEFGMSFSCT